MKRIAVTVIGGLLLITGVAALVLPGPGMVLCAAGLGLLATQYEWARRSLGWVKQRARDSVERTAASRLATAASVAGGLVLLAVGVAELVNGLPLLTTVTALLVIPGGVFLAGTALWGRGQFLRARR